MSIKIGSTIQKLDPADTYKLMNIADIEGAESLVSDVSAVKAKVSNLYAPDQTTFEQLVNAIVDTKVKSAATLPTGIPKVYGSYGTNIPNTLTQQGIFSSTSGVLHMTNAAGTSLRIFVAVQNDTGQADGVTGIALDDSPAAVWESRDTTYASVKYRVFYSNLAYKSATNKVTVKFTSQE